MQGVTPKPVLKCHWPRRRVLVRVRAPAWDVFPASYEVVKWQSYYVEGEGWKWKRYW